MIGSPHNSRGAMMRGVAAIEFAFLLIPLTFMIFGTTELGRAIYSYNTLDKTVRDAVRHLSQNGPGIDQIKLEAECLTVFGRFETPTTPGGDPCPFPPQQAVVAGLTKGMVQVCDSVRCTLAGAVWSGADHVVQIDEDEFGSMNLVSVAIVGYPYKSWVHFIVPDLVFNTIKVTMRGLQ